MTNWRRPRWCTGAAVLVLALAACSGDPGAADRAAPTPTSSVRTLPPLPPPPTPPATGLLYADLRQSSRDAALGRMQVWIRNDTEHAITPTSISYHDDRFRTALTGERLRAIPARAERGYPLTLPRRPRCGSQATSGIVRISYGDRHESLAVEDVTDVAGRHWSSRCLELGVASVARLSWADTVATDHDGAGSVGTLVLRVEPTGRAGSTLRIQTVGGTPLLTPREGAVWEVGLTVQGTDAPTEVPLEVIPSRCDPHVFMESGGATAFRVRLELDGEPGDLVLRMSPQGASSAIAFARDSCGLS